MFLWAQGEADALKIELRYRKATGSAERKNKLLQSDLLRYEKALRWVISEIRSSSGSAKARFGIQKLGRRVSLVNTHIGIHEIRKIQHKIAKSITNVKLLADMYDVSLRDSVHLDNQGQKIVLDRIIANIKRWLEQKPIKLGPTIERAFLSTNQKLLIVKLKTNGPISIGQKAHYLFTLIDKNRQIVAHATSTIKLNNQTLALRFNHQIDNSMILVVGLGSITDIGKANINLKEVGKFVTDSLDLPIQPSETRLE